MEMLDDRDIIVACNLALEELTGFDRRELIGKPALELISPASQHLLSRQLAAQRSGEAHPCELVFLTRDGKEMRIRHEATPMFDRSGTFIGSVCTLYRQGAAGALERELTARQREISDLLTRGMSREEIAKHLSIAENTVRNHVKSIYRKLGVHSQTELMALRRARP